MATVSLSRRRGALLARLAADAQALADPALTPEVDLAAALLALMHSGASQDSVFGY